jgi:hypothetical protein
MTSQEIFVYLVVRLEHTFPRSFLNACIYICVYIYILRRYFQMWLQKSNAWTLFTCPETRRKDIFKNCPKYSFIVMALNCNVQWNNNYKNQYTNLTSYPTDYRFYLQNHKCKRYCNFIFKGQPYNMLDMAFNDPTKNTLPYILTCNLLSRPGIQNGCPTVEEIDDFRWNVRVTLLFSLCDHLGILESNIMAISENTRRVFRSGLLFLRC